MGVFDGIKDFFSGSKKKKPLSSVAPKANNNGNSGNFSVTNPMLPTAKAEPDLTLNETAVDNLDKTSIVPSTTAEVASSEASISENSTSENIGAGINSVLSAKDLIVNVLGLNDWRKTRKAGYEEEVVDSDGKKSKRINKTARKLNNDSGKDAFANIIKSGTGFSGSVVGLVKNVQGLTENPAIKAAGVGLGAASGALTVAEGLYKGGKEAFKLHKTRMFTPLSAKGLEWRKFIKNKQWSRLGVNAAKITAGSLAIAGNVASMGGLSVASSAIGIGLTLAKNREYIVDSIKNPNKRVKGFTEDSKKLGNWIEDKTGIAEKSKPARDKIGAAASYIGNGALGLAKSAGGWIGDKANKAGNWIEDKTGIVEKTKPIRDKVGAAARFVGNGAFGLAKSAGSWIGDKASKAGSWIGDKASKAGSWIGDKANKAGSWIGEKTKPARDWIGEKAEAIDNWAGGGRDKYWENMGMADKRTPAAQPRTEKLSKDSVAKELIESAKEIDGEKLSEMKYLFNRSKDESVTEKQRKESAAKLGGMDKKESYDAANLLEGLGVSLEMAKGDGDKVEELVRKRISVTGSI